MEALRNLQVAELVRTLRISDDGQRLDQNLPPTELVAGDIILLEPGQRVPADVRIIHCSSSTEVDNAALTGETIPEPRTASPEPSTVPAMEARCLAFFGTSVLKGTATCVVHATGDGTFLGQIANTMKKGSPRSSLEVQMESFVHLIAKVAGGVALCVLLANLLAPKLRTAPEILENCATALFTQVPEGLLPTVTFSLMIASSRMSRQQVIVKKLDAIESLGCASVFCSDKTGTLTTGEMTVQHVLVPDAAGASLFGALQLQAEVVRGDLRLQQLAAAALTNNSVQAGAGGAEVVGSPTEVAICRAAASMLGKPAREAVKFAAREDVVFEIPFNSENKWMLTVHRLREDSSFEVIVKGAPERVLQLCKANEKISGELRALMDKGLRVLALAARRLAPQDVPPKAEFQGACFNTCNFPVQDCDFLGFFAMEDPPRPGVSEAVQKSQAAGVKVVMVTGDHGDTAKAIALRLNILARRGAS